MRSRHQRFSAAALMVVVLIAGCGATRSRSTPTAPTRTTGHLTSSALRAASNRAASRRDALALVGRVLLPAGSKRLTAEPHGDNGYLKFRDESLEGDQANSLAHGWWELRGTPGALIAFVSAHPPTGATPTGTGSAGNVYTGTTAETLGYQWPKVGDVLLNRELQLTVTALPGGKVGVLVEAQSDWIVPRPSTEQIPASTGEITITSGQPHKPSSLSLSVTNGSEVRRIVQLINSLPIAQPITYACPLAADPRFITMTFRANLRTKALAVLNYADFRPWSTPSWGCKTVMLTIGGRRQNPLIGGYFLQKIGRILGRSLT